MAQEDNIEKFNTDYYTGLNSEQVKKRIDEGLVNNFVTSKTKSYKQIFKSNLLTFFNILNFVLAGLVVISGQYKDLVFMLVVFGNLVIGICQEIISKKTLDKLNLVVATKAIVVRNTKLQEIDMSELVLDDIVVLKAGNQVCADGIIVNGDLEVNESLISGESDVIVKKIGDNLSSGSFIVSGNAFVRIVNVGADNLVHKIAGIAKIEKQRKSQLKVALSRILKLVSSILIPLGILLFIKQFYIGIEWNQNIVKTVAALIGMIPEGLILLTSISLATGAIVLATRQTLVQDLYCIETLARVDTLCLDKTGTLTQGIMKFKNIKKLVDFDDEKIIANICGALNEENSTFIAIKDKYGAKSDYKVLHTIPFSSARKYSGVTFLDEGSYILGANEMVFPNNPIDESLTASTNRVLVLAKTNTQITDNTLPLGLSPIAYIFISDTIRENAKETMEYFYSQDVDIKIISGDSASTVSEIATAAGVKDAHLAVDATTLKTVEEVRDAVIKYNVFGRVSPEQKQQMISALKAKGHTVAMTGDGVNDVMALKEADCSVAMASGSDAAKNVSDIVLLDSNFQSMPSVVAEGRRVINNIERVATMFISKTVFSVLLALFTLVLSQYSYPFSPMQLTLISFINIGFPAFFLALEPNNRRIEGSFIINVLTKSLPGGLTMFINILLVNLISSFIPLSAEVVSTACIFLSVVGGLWIVIKVSRPFTTIRKIILLATIVLFIVCFTFFKDFFGVAAMPTSMIVFCGVLAVVMPLIMWAMEWVARRIIAFIYAVQKVRGKT